MHVFREPESGVTVLQALIVILILIMVGTTVVLSGNTGWNTRQKPPVGMISSALAMTGDMLAQKDPLVGFPAVNGVRENVSCIFPEQEPGKLGGVQMTVSLLVGDMGGIDMDRTNVSFTTRRGTMMIPKAGAGSSVYSPNWTITSKSNWLPYRSADSDNILEPNEQFGILVLLPESLSPYDPFTLTFQPEDAMPLSVSSQVPPVIQPRMTLS